MCILVKDERSKMEKKVVDVDSCGGEKEGRAQVKNGKVMFTFLCGQILDEEETKSNKEKRGGGIEKGEELFQSEPEKS